MRFLFAKKRNIVCQKCGAEILYGEFFIRDFFKNEDVVVNNPYHYQCFIEVITERIRKRALYWQEKQSPPKKMGRPPKTILPSKYRKLKALQRYHRKAGHDEEVQKIEVQIRGIIDACV